MQYCTLLVGLGNRRLSLLTPLLPLVVGGLVFIEENGTTPFRRAQFNIVDKYRWVSFFINRFRKVGFIKHNGTMQVHSSRLNVIVHD